MRIVQYPHYLFVETTTDSKQGPTGEWLPSERSLILHARCREETGGSGNEIQTAGGTYRRYHSTVQLPKGTPVVQEGARVIVSDDAEGMSIRIDGVVLGFSSDQLHARLWL